jgi:hypothetical protein
MSWKMNEQFMECTNMKSFNIAILGLLILGVPFLIAEAQPASAQVVIFEDNPERINDDDRNKVFVPDLSARGARKPTLRGSGSFGNNAASGFTRQGATARNVVRFDNVLPKTQMSDDRLNRERSGRGFDNGGAAKIFQSEKMVGVSEEFAGSPLFGIEGAERPWGIETGKVELREDGLFHLDMQGLVRTDTARNELDRFAAVVSCASPDGTFSTLRTSEFPADGFGNAMHEETLDLPRPCFAPMVFVTTPDGRWIAVAGN